ncbi:hypothetical protein GW17_00049238 [Ensete ventricosum]|nr:hypothetical protein GW17_00049238 [Ensete ventricosum]
MGCHFYISPSSPAQLLLRTNLGDSVEAMASTELLRSTGICTYDVVLTRPGVYGLFCSERKKVHRNLLWLGGSYELWIGSGGKERCRGRPQKRRTRRRAEVREERRMRSSVQAGDDASEGSAAFAACWWRCLIEFDGGGEGGRTEAAAGSRGAGASPRVRVLRELERLAAAANVSLDDIRHKLLTYNAGDLWLPAGGISKQETDIPPVITILLLGLAGTGKTALVELMYCVLGRSGFLPFAQSIPLAGSCFLQ